LARLGRQSQARHSSGLQKASALSKLFAGFPRAERLQGPKKHLSPTRGKRVGGVSGRPAREAGRSDPVRSSWSRRWKAPGLRKGVNLRGRALERRPRSVRHVRRGLLLGGRSHRRQWVFFGRRGGERRQLAASKARAPDARVLKKTPRVSWGHVLHSVRRPVHVNPGSTQQRGNPRAVRRTVFHRGRANSGNREEPAPRRRHHGRSAARHASTLSQERQQDAQKKRKVVAATVPARKRESRSQCPYVVAVAEVGRRTSGLEYARAQGSKKSHGASERGPSSEPSSAVKRR